MRRGNASPSNNKWLNRNSSLFSEFIEGFQDEEESSKDQEEDQFNWIPKPLKIISDKPVKSISILPPPTKKKDEVPQVIIDQSEISESIVDKTIELEDIPKNLIIAPTDIELPKLSEDSDSSGLQLNVSIDSEQSRDQLFTIKQQESSEEEMPRQGFQKAYFQDLAKQKLEQRRQTIVQKEYEAIQEQRNRQNNIFRNDFKKRIQAKDQTQNVLHPQIFQLTSDFIFFPMYNEEKHYLLEHQPNLVNFPLQSYTNDNLEDGYSDSSEDNEDEIEQLADESIKQQYPNLKEDLQAQLEATNINKSGNIITALIIPSFFIVICLLINPIENTSIVTNSIRQVLELNRWQIDPDKLFQDIDTLDELDQYIRTTLLPQLFHSEFFLEQNYLLGLRITLKFAQLEENPYEDYEFAKQIIKRNPDMSARKQNDYEWQEDTWFGEYQEDKGFYDHGGYIFYYMKVPFDIILINWRSIIALLSGEPRNVSIVFDFLFHNSNYQSTVYYYQIYEFSSQGQLNVDSGVIGIFPEIFEKISGRLLAFIILSTFYLIGLIIQFFNAISIIYWGLKGFLVQRRLDIKWDQWIDIINVVLVIITIGLFINVVVLFQGNFKLPLEDDDEFDDLTDYAINYRTLVRFMSITMILTGLRIIAVLKQMFPSFGILFETVRAAKADIFKFLTVALVLMFCFSVGGHIAFGLTLQGYSTLQESLLSHFEMVFGQVDFSDILSFEMTFGSIFLSIYLILFYFILMNMFLAIVMSTYRELRRQNQKIVEAKAYFLAKQAQEKNERIRDLILCRITTKDVDDLVEQYLKQEGQQIDKKDQEAIREWNSKMQVLKTQILNQKTEQSIINIIKYNISQLIISQSGSQIETKEQQYIKLVKQIYLLEQDRVRDRIRWRKQVNRVQWNWKMLQEMLIFTIYIFIYSFMIISIVDIPSQFYTREVLNHAIQVLKFDGERQIKDIAKETDIMDFFQTFWIPSLLQVFSGSNIMIIPNPLGRLTIRLYKDKKNDFSSSDNVFPRIIGIDQWTDVEQLSEDFVGESGMEYNFRKPGEYDTFQTYGGYTFDIIEDGQEIKRVLANIQTDILDNPEKYLLNLALECSVYNANKQIFIYYYINGVVLPSGYVEWNYWLTSLNLEIITSSQLTSFIFHVLFLLFNIFDTYFVLRTYILEWRKVNSERDIKKIRSIRTRMVVAKIQGKEFNHDSGILSSIFGLLRYLLELVEMGIMSLVRTIKKDFFMVFNIVSVVLSYIAIIVILIFMTDDFKNNFTLESYYQNEDQDHLEHLAYLSYLIWIYGTIAQFNCILLYIRMLQYLKLSRQMSILTDVIDRAKLDLVFFLLMVVIILVSFSVASFFLFGNYIKFHQKFSQSLVSNYNMIYGEFDTEQLYNADNELGSFYYILFMILFNLLLLNMFIAIINSYFTQVKQDFQVVQDIGFFKKIFVVIKRHFLGKKWMTDNRMKQEKVPKAAVRQNQQNKLQNTNEIEFKLKNLIPDKKLPIVWLSNLENIIYIQSNGQIKLGQLKMQEWEHSDQLPEALSQLDHQKYIYLNKAIWSDLSLLDKLEGWRCIQIQAQNIREKYNQRAEQYRTQDRQRYEFILKLKLKLWNSTTLQEQLQLWGGNICRFNNSERAEVWNFLPFFESGATITSRNLVDWKITWKQLNNEQKEQSIKAYLKVSKRIKKGNKIEDLLNDENLHQYPRLLYLMALNNQQKFELFFNITDEIESEIFAFILLAINENIFAIQHADQTLEHYLDRKLLDKMNELSVWQSESYKMYQLQEKINQFENEYNYIESYQKYLLSEIKRYQHLLMQHYKIDTREYFD